MGGQTFAYQIQTASTDATKERLREAFRERLSTFTGTSKYRRRGRLFYTDGVKYLADEGEAYWLLDVVKSYVPHVLRRMDETEIRKHTALLKVGGQEGTVQLFDRWIPNPNVVYGSRKGGRASLDAYQSQKIAYTDFPLSEIKLVVGPKPNGPVIEGTEDLGGAILSLPQES